ncbi:MAG: ATP-binding protein [Candidatus Omnitrophica bacterium]|nr:ATP-binding protein [Candidatus Omnitrophota bacterium]
MPFTSVISRIALTGGPGGGKTSLLSLVMERAPTSAGLFAVPEAATVLIRAGLVPGSFSFQRAVFHLQLSLENAVAEATEREGVLVCDRGTLDSLAYWRLLGGSEEGFWEFSGMTREEHLARYLGVIHLETAAVGASEHYTRSEIGRPEPPEEAARIDSLCRSAWEGHPNRVFIPNTPGGWSEKLERAWAAVGGMLG